MKALIILALICTANLTYAAQCGCHTKIVDVHDHEGSECEKNEVMVGYDTEAGVVKCGTIKCDSCCAPSDKK